MFTFRIGRHNSFGAVTGRGTRHSSTYNYQVRTQEAVRVSLKSNYYHAYKQKPNISFITNDAEHSPAKKPINFDYTAKNPSLTALHKTKHPLPKHRKIRLAY